MVSQNWYSNLKWCPISNGVKNVSNAAHFCPELKNVPNSKMSRMLPTFSRTQKCPKLPTFRILAPIRITPFQNKYFIEFSQIYNNHFLAISDNIKLFCTSHRNYDLWFICILKNSLIRWFGVKDFNFKLHFWTWNQYQNRILRPRKLKNEFL